MSAVEEIRYVVKKQERELEDLRTKMRDSVSETNSGVVGIAESSSTMRSAVHLVV